MAKLILFLLTSLLLTPPIFAHSTTQIIEITKEGFKPNEVTVDTNTTVIFQNSDSQSRWPASDIHPTHEIYPEFDPKMPLEAGKSWSFKPTKAGTWKYHDHLFPHIRGTLVVSAEDSGNSESSAPTSQTTDEPNLLKKAQDTILKLIDRIKSYFSPKQIYQPPKKDTFLSLTPQSQLDTLKDISQNLGSQKAWDFVKDTFKGRAGSSGNIHDLAHLSGNLIYKEKGFGGIGVCTKEFAFGCYHGFLDSAFAKNLDHLLDAEAACQKLGPVNSGPVASCIHGIGHGIASFHSVQNLEKSLSTCNNLTSGNEYCFDGVFMEYVRNASDSFFNPNDPLFPCNALEQKFGYRYSNACGRNQPTLLVTRLKKNFQQVSQICLSSESNQFKNACFEALGFMAASTADVQTILSVCQVINVPKYTLSCIKAAAGELIFQEVPLWSEKSSQLCDSFESGKAECIEHTDRIIREYGRTRTINFDTLKKGEDENAYTRNQLKICYSLEGKDSCYKQVAKVLYGQFGLAKTLKLLKANENHQEVYARCHEVTHYLSRAEYDKLADIGKVYSQCDSTCHGGCYHGTLEAYLKKQEATPNFNLSTHFPTICKRSDYQTPIVYNECLHGLGHAAMFITDMQLPNSLKLCDQLKEQAHIDRCYTGVFMENSSSSTSADHTSLYIKKDDPFYPCNSLEEKYQAVCWQYQSSYFAIISGQDWQKVAQMCLQIPDKYQDNCFRTIGTNQVGFTRSMQVMKQDCDLMPTPHFKNICVLGVVSSLSYRFVGDVQKMVDFCALVDSDNKQTCYTQMGTALKDWTTDKGQITQNCLKIPDQNGADWCSKAI